MKNRPRARRARGRRTCECRGALEARTYLGAGDWEVVPVHRSLFTVHGSKTRRMIVKLPRQPELRRAVLRQRFDSNRLGGVVAGVDGVDPELPRIEVGVVGALAGDGRLPTGRLCC